MESEAAETRAGRPSGPPVYYRVFLAALVIASPFNGLPMPHLAGEMSNEAAFYLSFVLIIPFLSRILTGRAYLSVTVLFGAATLLLAILASLIANQAQIQAGSFGGRAGMTKWLTTTSTVTYFWVFCSAMVDLAARYGLNGVLNSLSKGAMAIAAVLVAEYSFEVASWYAPPLRALLTQVAPLWNFNVALNGYDNRLRGFSFEPSFQCLSAVSIAALTGWRVLGPDRGKGGPLLVLCLFTGFQFISGSRTALACLASISAALILMIAANRTPAHLAKASFVLLLPCALQAFAIRNLATGPITTLTTSDITRSANILTSVRMFLEHPWFGFGFGQYSIQYVNFVPSWARQSWEVRQFISPVGLGLPSSMPSYNLYARLAGETGLLGLTAWAAFQVVLLAGLFRYLVLHPWRSGDRTSVDWRATAPVLIIGVAGTAAAGTSLDSFRLYGIWIFASLAAVFLEQRTTAPATRRVGAPVQT